MNDKTARESPIVAAQAWTFRHDFDLVQEADTTLARVSAAGYQHLELAGTGRQHPQTVQDLCARAALNVIGIHQPPLRSDVLEELADEMILYSKCFGAPYITVVSDPLERRTLQYYENYADSCSKLAAILRDSLDDFVLSFHPYVFDHEQLDSQGRSGVQVLLDLTSPEDLSLQLDVLFAFRARIDVPEFLSKWGSRCKTFHLNDLEQDRGRQCALGDGVLPLQDWLPAILAKAPDVLVVEHNTKNPIESLTRSYAYLSRLLPNL